MSVRFLVILLVAASLATTCAYGHGIGEETLPPQDLGDRQVFIRVNAVSIEDSDIDQQFTFELINMETGETVKDVTYQLKASKQNAVLFDEIFKSSSGSLVIDLVNSDSGEIQIEKRALGVLGFVSGDTAMARVTGPYFDYGGLYHFDIKVLTADGFSNELNPPLAWNSGISIADTTRHSIDDANFGEQTFTHISYYDIVENFEYDPSTRSISFEMPFDGSFESINQTSIVHEEVQFSKGFGDLMISNITATVNGLKMPPEVIQIDDFTEDIRIVHLSMIKSNVLELYEKGKISEDRLNFVMSPSAPELPYSVITKNGQFKIIMEAVPANPASGEEVEIRYKLLDVFLKDRPVKAEYDMYVVQDDMMLFSADGVSSDEVGRFESAKFVVPDGVTGVIYVHFKNLGGNSLASARLPVVIDRIVSGTPDASQSIPGWIKGNAGLWADGMISDDEFVSAMEYLINNGIIRI